MRSADPSGASESTSRRQMSSRTQESVVFLRLTPESIRPASDAQETKLMET